jgi:hypothetical protein
MVFQATILCIGHYGLCNGEYKKDYTDGNIYILSDSQADIKALDSLQKISMGRPSVPVESGRT